MTVILDVDTLWNTEGDDDPEPAYLGCTTADGRFWADRDHRYTPDELRAIADKLEARDARG